MGRTILCKKCQSTFNESVLANRENPNICPVCGESLIDDDSFGEPPKETTKWYYYKEGGGTLTDTLYNRSPLYTFDATDVEDAKRQLKEVLPNSPLVKEKTKWYYYKGLTETLDDMLYDDFTPLYTFDATDVEDAKRQLKEVLPNSPLVNDNSPDIVRCPRCRSTQIQMVPRKFSLLTGFATNKIDRMCVRCQKRF
ncbi:hypothetical protein D7V94_20300 [Parablautia intestinalis]|uniref:Zinc ribbon domain-containing protein n=1 Tax=Parablautia intestinalis TaxID=2320100 RepID=A0A3A9AKS3_9FIRM|nr:hypothetical protein [Parablautia intestinalis]RKI87906.1 hypothetical protein D7V94_20300 [Parablautia intestinalis]